LSAHAKHIAIYGKGGIGKSTIAANLTAAMSQAGARVLQIGCDPKQDSTRLLLSGRRITTVLEYLKTTQPLQRKLEDVVATGYGGVACVEAGGPEPGVGCAGRGILSTFDLLEKLDVATRDFDVTLYDVLGDVVCGGFAVPLRNEYAEIVYVVTSGEFMALYAANNILRGVRNFEANGPRLGGLILNQRGLEDEEACVRRFAEAVCLPIVAVFPRSNLFAEAEHAMQPIIAALPESELASAFTALAHYLLDAPPRYAAKPLTPGALEEVVLGNARGEETRPAQPVSASAQIAPPERSHVVPGLPARPARYYSKGVRDHTTLFGCAFNGAAHTALQISGAAVVAHGPRSCAFLSSLGIVSSLRRSWRRYGVRSPFPPASELFSSDMDERVVIFGGNEGLETALRRAAQRGPSVIFVVTTCSAGIIGDDLRLSLARTRGALDGIPVVTLPADGDLSGDYSQGVLDAATAIGERFIDPSVTPEGTSVNIVGEKNLVNQTDVTFRGIEQLLREIDVTVNCRFIRNCTRTQLAGFRKARLNLLAYEDLFGRTLRDFLVERYQSRFASLPFPVGFRQTEKWLREVGTVFDRRERADEIIAAHRELYREQVQTMRPALAGKRVFIATQNRHIDWLLDTILDLGMEIVRVGVLDSAWDDEVRTRYADRVPFVIPYQREQRLNDIRELAPDLTLTDFRWAGAPHAARICAIPFAFGVGFDGGLAFAERWRDVLRAPAKEGWRYDL
jgi:nitrogenase iron protein